MIILILTKAPSYLFCPRKDAKKNIMISKIFRVKKKEGRQEWQPSFSSTTIIKLLAKFYCRMVDVGLEYS